MNNPSKRYYECQSDLTWSEQRADFDEKMNELRQLKTDLSDHKRSLLSPKHHTLTPSKAEEIHLLLALKQEENVSLTHLLEHEKAKLREASLDLSRAKSFYTDLEGKLNLTQLQLSEKEKLLNRFYNEMGVIKTNVHQWLSPNSASPKKEHSTGISIHIQELGEKKNLPSTDTSNQEVQRLRRQLEDTQELYKIASQELREVKERIFSNEKLSAYTRLPRERKIIMEETERDAEIEEKYNREVGSIRRELELRIVEQDKERRIFQEGEEGYKRKVIELENNAEVLKGDVAGAKENYEKLEKERDLEINEMKKIIERRNQEIFFLKEDRAKSKIDPKIEKEILEEYKNNIKILSENNELLCEKIKIYENERCSILLEQDINSQKTAEDFTNFIIKSSSTPGIDRQRIQENLCKLMIDNKDLFKVSAYIGYIKLRLRR